MPERDMRPQAGNARRFTIDADAGETAIEVLLPAQLPGNRQPNQYRIVKKDIPPEARAMLFRGKAVKWINNHGIRLLGSFKNRDRRDVQDPFIEEIEGEQFDYEVIVPGPAPEGLPTLVYFDGNAVQPANATLQDDGFYHFTLNIGDPADGWGG